MSESFTHYLLSLMGQLDYWAVFWLMAAESSILPVPSELVMIPAGYLAVTGQLNFWLVLLAGNLGSITGSLISYYLALWLGRPVLIRYGKYLLLTEHHLTKAERFIHHHGEIAIFTGRLVPGVRHLISMPAGIARMAIDRFIIYTLLGSSLWNVILQVIGYWVGDNQIWLRENWSWIILISLAGVSFVVIIYLYLLRQRQARGHTNE